MANFLSCDLKELGLQAILALVLESDGAGGAQLKTGAASGVAGGLSVYTNLNDSDFVATPTVGTKNVVITGLGFTIEADNVAVGAAYLVDATGNYTSIPVKTLTTVAAGTVTLGGMTDNFAAGETVVMLLIGKTKAYAILQDLLKVSNETPEWGHYTEPEHLVDEADEAAGTNRFIIEAEGYRFLSLHVKLYAATADDTVTLTFWATNNEDADDTADTDWVDISATVLGGASIAANNATVEEIHFIDTAFIPLRYMVKIVYAYGGGGSADNAADVYVKKSA